MCDSCTRPCPFYKKTLPFDGQFVRKTWKPGTTHEVLQKEYERGSIDATWWCTYCHAGLNPSKQDIEKVRNKLGLNFVHIRKERTKNDPNRYTPIRTPTRQQSRYKKSLECHDKHNQHNQDVEQLHEALRLNCLQIHDRRTPNRTRYSKTIDLHGL